MASTNITDPRLSYVTQKVITAAKDTLGERLNKVILNARGDFDNYSAVDIFVLADVPHEDANKWCNRRKAI